MEWIKSQRAGQRWCQGLKHAAQAGQFAHRFRPGVEALEDRLQLGDTLLGVSVVALVGLEFASWDTSVALAPSGSAQTGQDGLFSSWEAADPFVLIALTKRAPSEEAGTARIGDRAAGDRMTQTAETFGLAMSGYEGALPGARAVYRLGSTDLAVSPALAVAFGGTGVGSALHSKDGGVALSSLALAGIGEPAGRPSLFASVSPLSFDGASGQLAIQATVGGHTVRETLTADAFVDITRDGQHHSSNPASASFDRALAGATVATLAGIRFDGGREDTLTVGSEHLAGAFTVQANGGTVVTENVVTAGPLTIQAANITVNGALQGSRVDLAATHMVDVRATGRIQATPSASGRVIAVSAETFVNSGELHADGLSGGEIVVQANQVLNAGPVTADARGGKGGQVHIAFTQSYLATAAAEVSVHSAAGPAGHLTIDGGSSGRLYSSGRHSATGSVGGSVDLFGREVLLVGARIDVSGEAGGGTVRIGEDSHGHHTAVRNVQAVTVTGATILQADALGRGNGGRVLVWADGDTSFAGTVSARGGPAGGAGGFIEVSGKGLAYAGTADAGAPAGRAGTLLLDPKNLVISDAPVGIFPQYDLIDPHPTSGGRFGDTVIREGNGNLIVFNPSDNFGGTNAGAVYVFNERTGTLLSDLVGSSPNDQVGGYTNYVTFLTNGNYVVSTPAWNGNRGAVTWASGTSGVSGVVSEANSLVGSNPGDQVGGNFGVTELRNGNYVVQSWAWNDGRGAVTWGSGTSGVSGVVSEANSLVGSDPGDYVGHYLYGGVTVLSNGNYVVQSWAWNDGRGAATWGSGTTGVRGVVSEANSLVGSSPGDHVGARVAALSNGNYVVESPSWNGGRGAATWGDGTTGVRGVVSETNSLVGSSPNDLLGWVAALSTGNYVVVSGYGTRGAVTWGSGTTGISGTVSDANSLVGSHARDYVGSGLYNGGVIVLKSGNYVVVSRNWNGGRGAVTWGSGTTGVRGTVSEANSLVGSSPNDSVGYFIPLNNGNYVVVSSYGGRGSVTWGSGTTEVRGAVSEANSLVGSNPGDYVGNRIWFLTNGNYVVLSSSWNGNRGAVTWGDGNSAIRGAVSEANSLVGSHPGDSVGSNVTVLDNSNYVVQSWVWNDGRGAATWGSGTSGVRGVVSEANSLVGSSPGDHVGGGVAALSNGNYVVQSPSWNGNRGAATWGSGTTGTSGVVSEANSLVGSNPGDGNLYGSSPGDSVDFPGVTRLSNGNYLVNSGLWNGNRGAVTWGNGSTGTSGVVSEANSLVGSNPGDYVGLTDRRGFSGGRALSNGNYVVQSPFWNDNRGAVTWGNGSTGTSGVVSEANSLVGSKPGDQVGSGIPLSHDYNGLPGVVPLRNGNYVVRSPYWNRSPYGNGQGALTWGDGSTGTSGTVSQANSLIGTGYWITPLSNGSYVVDTPFWNGGRGAVTWVNGTIGQTLDSLNTITPQNSLLGRSSYMNLRFHSENPADHTLLAVAPADDNRGRVVIGMTDPNQLVFDQALAQTLTITPAFLTQILNTGTAVVLQASNDITVNSPITVRADHGGALTLQAGRSIVLNASLTSGNGPLTLVANAGLSSGVVDGERDPGNASITMAPGTALDTGSAALTAELGDGAGLASRDSGAITLQTVTAGSVAVVNHGPSTPSDIELGTVTTIGSQYYSSPRGTIGVNGNLTAADSAITFTDSVDVQDGVTLTAGANAIYFVGNGLQRLHSGSNSRFGNINHTATGTLQLSSSLTVSGSFVNAAGTFDANDEPVTVSGAAAILGGTYLAGTAPQNFPSGLSILSGALSSSTGPMDVRGTVRLLGGSLGGVGTVDAVTALGGTMVPGGDNPGVLSIRGAFALDSSSTLGILLNGTEPGTGYAQLQAGGPVELDGSTLRLSFGFMPPVGSSFEILTNSGSAPIMGRFGGLEEGAVFVQDDYQFQITYQGGTGGDSVVLTRLV